MTALLTVRPAPVGLALIDAVETAAGRPLAASVVTTIVGIVRDTRPAIPRRVWIAQMLGSGRGRPTAEALATAAAIVVAVHQHDYRRARGQA